VHGADIDVDHVVIHGIEHALLDLTGVLGSEDEHHFPRQRLRDQQPGVLDADALALGLGKLAFTAVDDDPVGTE